VQNKVQSKLVKVALSKALGSKTVGLVADGAHKQALVCVGVRVRVVAIVGGDEELLNY
jgi:hypothetical protein